MNAKERIAVLTIIKRRGDCTDILCSICPLVNTRCQNVNDRYETLVNLYAEEVGLEQLVEELM
jgi:hypothetical protein